MPTHFKPMSFAFASRRSMVLGQGGMVAANNPLAAQAGLDVLRRGGNAADAAVATAAVLNVTDPASTGIGGDVFALYYDAKTGAVSALNGSGRAPRALSIDLLAAQGISGAIPDRSVHAITVPGAARAWEDLLARHGRMGLGEVLRDAIRYARDGFPVHPVFGHTWASERVQKFLAASPNTQDYLPDGQGARVGQVVRLPGLARTFQAVAEGGADAFYGGDIADAIVRTVQGLGGTLTHADLTHHSSTWETPISTIYRGVTVHECPPNGQGLAALIALNIAEGFGLGEMAWDDPQRLHLMVEAMRLAFADARQYIADPAVVPAPLAGLLDKAYAAQRRTLISPNAAMQPPSYGAPFGGSNTVYLCAADAEGNACSFINSLYMGFGTGIVAEGAGFFLQNRGANFSLDSGHPNALAGGKRPYHTIIPGMMTRDGALVGPFGVMGGFMQPQGHFQVVSGMVDDLLNPQEALDRPRWCLTEGTPDSVLALEDGVPVAAMARLAAIGHSVKPVTGSDRLLFGSGQIIVRDPESGVLFGGCDPRKDSVVATF
jgi:gamma-glutamyltranspeptidase/glutathione hydrolase